MCIYMQGSPRVAYIYRVYVALQGLHIYIYVYIYARLSKGCIYICELKRSDTSPLIAMSCLCFMTI